VLLIESVINRIQYLRGENPLKKPIKFVRDTFPTNGFADYLEELFVVRDVIAHNHIWEAQIFWDENYDLKLISANLSAGYGDNKFNQVVDPKSRSTKLLKINLFPTRISKQDCVITLKRAVEFLLFLENQDRN